MLRIDIALVDWAEIEVSAHVRERQRRKKQDTIMFWRAMRAGMVPPITRGGLYWSNHQGSIYLRRPICSLHSRRRGPSTTNYYIWIVIELGWVHTKSAVPSKTIGYGGRSVPEEP